MNIEDNYKICSDCKKLFSKKEMVSFVMDDGSDNHETIYICLRCLADEYGVTRERMEQ